MTKHDKQSSNQEKKVISETFQHSLSMSFILLLLSSACFYPSMLRKQNNVKPKKIFSTISVEEEELTRLYRESLEKFLFVQEEQGISIFSTKETTLIQAQKSLPKILQKYARRLRGFYALITTNELNRLKRQINKKEYMKFQTSNFLTSFEELKNCFERYLTYEEREAKSRENFGFFDRQPIRERIKNIKQIVFSPYGKVINEFISKQSDDLFILLPQLHYAESEDSQKIMPWIIEGLEIVMNVAKSQKYLAEIRNFLFDHHVTDVFGFEGSGFHDDRWLPLLNETLISQKKNRFLEKSRNFSRLKKTKNFNDSLNFCVDDLAAMSIQSDLFHLEENLKKSLTNFPYTKKDFIKQALATKHFLNTKKLKIFLEAALAAEVQGHNKKLLMAKIKTYRKLIILRERNRAAIKHAQTILKDTGRKVIAIQFGRGHFTPSEMILNDVPGFFATGDVFKNFQEILEEKQISYLVIDPNKK